MKTHLFVALASALVFAASAAGQNLLHNSGFDASLASWQAGDGTTWDGTRDAAGAAASGSARGSATFSDYGSALVVSQCVDGVLPGSEYVLSGKIFIPGGQSTANGVILGVTPYIDAHCSGPLPPLVPLGGPPPLITTVGRWTPAATATTAIGASILVSAILVADGPGSFQANLDDLRFAPITASTCRFDEETLCLHGLRFRVTASFDAGHGNAGAGRTEALTGESGYMSFFDPYNVEVTVKMVDGCDLGGHYWFFAAGLTNVAVTLTVTDLETGAVKTYTNPLGRPFATVADTSAFACP